MGFIHDDFLLHSPAARRLYHEFAAPEPILDFHCHLPPEDIAENRRFENLYDIWLAGDHYKWRAMRANGVEERYITGDATPYEKFLAWARTVPATLRNPLFHWTHLELKRYFDFDDLLTEATAPAVWQRAAEVLADEDLRVHGILRRFRVCALCTTDDPASDLRHHRRIAAEGAPARVFPTFRPDNAFQVHRPAVFRPWIERLGAAANKHIGNMIDFLEALRGRHDEFHAAGCRLSDHGLDRCPGRPPTGSDAAMIFNRALEGHAASPEEQRKFTAFLLPFFARLDAERGWTKQLHLGARRNNNTRMLARLGPDTGYDAIGGWNQVDALAEFLDSLDRENALPRMILYNLNPADSYAISTLAGCFQDGSVRAKIQFGSGWWFLDQKEGIEWQLNALSNTGLLSRFVGMLTDSRSFMSYPRHEYFRRVLSNLLGQEIERDEIPEDLAGELVRNVCFGNARRWLGLPV